MFALKKLNEIWTEPTKIKIKWKQILFTTKQNHINSFAVGDINSWRLGCIEENDHETAV